MPKSITATTLDRYKRMALAFYDSCPDGQFAEFCVNAAAALAAMDAVMPKAQELFQSGGKFASMLMLGDQITVRGFALMAKFCERHAEQFIAETSHA